MSSNCCILIAKDTRTKLKTIATKAQTYDDIINELIILKQTSVSEPPRIIAK
ncbi:MAG: hypothetical protein ACR2F1_12095 [Nitrososphaeraceae archaeon]